MAAGEETGAKVLRSVDTIAEFVEANPQERLRHTPWPVNAFTVDLEEWFHICGVDRLAADRWDAPPSRVEVTTRWLLDELDAAGIQATWFVLGWIAERHPRLVEDVRRAGHTIGSHGLHAHACLRAHLGDICRTSCSAAVSCSKASSTIPLRRFARPNGRSTRACRGPSIARTPLSFTSGRQHGAAAHRRPDRLPARSARASGRRRHGGRGPAVRGRSVRSRDANGVGWELRMSDRPGSPREVERANRADAPPSLQSAPVEIDSDPPRTRLPARQHFAHYFRIGGFANRLREILRVVPFTSLAARRGDGAINERVSRMTRSWTIVCRRLQTCLICAICAIRGALLSAAQSVERHGCRHVSGR